MTLTSKQRSIIKTTVPILAQHGTDITTHFYKNLLADNPSLRSLFSHSASPAGNSHQPQALAASLHAYANNIDDLAPILPVIEKISQKHASLNISADQYHVVGEGLLKSLRAVLGADVFTDEVHDAWAAAYGELADIMIGGEEKIVASHEETPGGWRGWRRMKCIRRVQESDEIASFYWTPMDGGELPTYESGQYVSVRIDVPKLDVKQIRQYSLSAAPPATAQRSPPPTNGASNGYKHISDSTSACSNGENDPPRNGASSGLKHIKGSTNSTKGMDSTKTRTNGQATLSNTYRITVRRDPGVPNSSAEHAVKHPGYVSNLLHDTICEGAVVDMSHPAGEFFLDDAISSDTSIPIALISAGVGLTPMMSILQTLLREEKQHSSETRPISWIHVARSKSADPFADDVARITSVYDNVTSRVYHSTPSEDEQVGHDYDVSGRMSLSQLSKDERRQLLHVNDPKTHYFVCGPDAFMADVDKALRGMGVDSGRIKMEVFGVGAVKGV